MIAIHNFSLRKLWFGFLTLSGIQKKGYFIPYAYAQSMAYDQTNSMKLMFGLAYPDMVDQLKATIPLVKDLQKINLDDNPPAPRWDQDWFPRLDAIMAYSFVRRYKPKNIIEVGSGHSTRFMAKAIQDGHLSTKFCAIDPCPRASLEGLPIAVHQTILQKVDRHIFNQIQPGDVVFIDSSHIFMPGTDVDYFFQEIFPILPKGCILHFHDIFLPHPYPQEWEGRNYNEQNILVLLLLNNIIKPLFSSSYILHKKLSDKNLNFFKKFFLKDGAYESSLWCQKR